MSAEKTERTASMRGGLALAVVFGAFVALGASKTATVGLCCGDDAYFASTAKNLAVGLGYGVTVYGQGFQLLHPEISVGPPLIVPLAVAMRLLGNRHWVPGFVAIAIWATLLVLVHHRLRRRAEVRNLHFASGVFLVGVVLLFPWHFEHWFTVLGEVPAALLLLLGVVVVGSELSRRTVAGACLLCSLAFLTKMVSALYCLSFAAALAGRVILVEKRSAREALRLGVVAAGAFLAPVLAFEAYKLVALGGLDGYRDNLAATRRFIATQGTGSSPSLAARFVRAFGYDHAVYARFGVRASLIATAALASGVALVRLGGPAQRRIAVPIVAGVLVTTTWFLFFSIGWPRYFVVTLLLSWALVALVLTTLGRARAAALGTAALLALLAMNHRKLPNLAAGLEKGPLVKSPALASALELATFIDANRARVAFASQWWATTADLEYYAASTDVFRHFRLLADRDEYYVAFNRAFRSQADPEFNALIAGCTPAERSFEPYALLRCGRRVPAPPEPSAPGTEGRN